MLCSALCAMGQGHSRRSDLVFWEMFSWLKLTKYHFIIRSTFIDWYLFRVSGGVFCYFHNKYWWNCNKRCSKFRAYCQHKDIKYIEFICITRLFNIYIVLKTIFPVLISKKVFKKFFDFFLNLEKVLLLILKLNVSLNH